MQPSSTLYILDEGIIQSLVSILFIDAIGGKQHIIRQIFNKLYKNGITWHQVDLDSDIQLSFNRVLERKSNLGRMDFMEEEELQKALAIQKETFSQIRILASDTGVAKNNLTVPSNDNVEHCANKIFDWINN